MENRKTGWFSIVPIVAVIFVFIGWNMHGNTAGTEKSFESEDINITFDYSREWIKSDDVGVGTSLIRLDNPQQKVHITKLRKPMVGMSLAQNSYNANIYMNYEKTREDKLEIAGAAALRIEFKYDVLDAEGNKKNRQAAEVVVDLGTYVAVITYSSPVDRFENGLENFEAIVESIEIQEL